MTLSRRLSLRMVWDQYRFQRAMFWRNPSAAFFSFFFPLLLLVMFGLLFKDRPDILEIILPGIAGMSVISATFSSFAYQITFQREQGILKRVRSTPLPIGNYIAGLTLSATTTTLIQLVMIVVAGRVVFDIGWPVDWALLAAFTVLGVACFSVLGVALANLIPNFDSAPAYVNAIFLPLLLISGVFYDAERVPALVRSVAEVLPLKHLIDGISSGMISGGGFGGSLTAFVAVGCWLILGLWYAVRGFRWENRS